MNALRFSTSLLALSGIFGAADLQPVRAAAKSTPDTVTFSEHIAPLVFQNCTRCHRPGEAAPFSLVTYEDARKRAKQIVEATSTRYMPPWHAESGHITYSNERRLTEEQIALLAAWESQGAKEGDPAKVPPTPRFPEGWQLGQPDLVLKMPEPFPVPAEGRDIYWNFVFPVQLPTTKWVRAIEFRPGARAVVHHSLYFLDTNGVARNYDNRDPKVGYNGGNRSNRQFLSLGGWALGGEALLLPPELAWEFPTNSDLVIQTHFHPSGKPEQEISMIGLYFAEKPPTRQFTMVQLPALFGRLSGLDIPAGTSNYVVRDSLTLPIDVEAFAVTPHAHYLAKTFHLTATLPDGRTQTILKVPDWDFNWQEDCAFQERLRLPKGTRLDAAVSYDNSASNPHNPTVPPKRVKWGPMTTDEMSAMTLSVVPARDAELSELTGVMRDHHIDLFIDRALEDVKQQERVKAMAALFDKNANGKIDSDERPALRAFLQEKGFLKGL